MINPRSISKIRISLMSACVFSKQYIILLEKMIWFLGGAGRLEVTAASAEVLFR
jgi:hypothetical protein